jgi:hypothetical protein
MSLARLTYLPAFVFYFRTNLVLHRKLYRQYRLLPFAFNALALVIPLLVLSLLYSLVLPALHLRPGPSVPPLR